jgi:hypothetical protein
LSNKSKMYVFFPHVSLEPKITFFFYLLRQISPNFYLCSLNLKP